MEPIRVRTIICDDKRHLGQVAADAGVTLIRKALRERGTANVIIATGASQFEMIGELVKADGIDWYKVTAFHLDEYVGLPIAQPASFRRSLGTLRHQRTGPKPGQLRYKEHRRTRKVLQPITLYRAML